MEISRRQSEGLFFALTVALAVFRFSYFGLSYTPYLDDYIQYSYYPQLQSYWQRVYVGGAGVLCTRPLAGLFDLIIWSRFWNNLGLAVGIISIMHGLSAVLMYKALNLCGLMVDVLFVVLYIFMPINCEATYWLSASSRIVVSMFFVSLSAYFGAKKSLIWFFLFNFVSMWFYEQTAVLGFVLSVWVCIAQKKRGWIVIPIISALALIIFYLRFGVLGDNAHRLVMTDLKGLWGTVTQTLYNFLKIMTAIQLKVLTKGFARGFARLAGDLSLMWLGGLTVLVILFFKLSQMLGGHKRKCHREVGLGVVLMLAPILPFFVLYGSAFNLRNAAPCVLGLAIILDRVMSEIPRRYVCALSAVLVFWFSIVSVSEVGDYRLTAKRDLELATQLAQKVDSDTTVIEVNAKVPKYYPQNAPFGDHIMSMTGSDWGMTGIVRAISGNGRVVVIKK